MALSDKTQIFVHCSATRPEWWSAKSLEDKVREFRRWHLARGFADIAYAVIIDRDGKVAYGRDLDNDGDFYEETAAAAKGYNTVGVHICLVGGHGSSENDKFSDHFTKEQDFAVRQEIQKIMRVVGKSLWVRGHNEVAAKACPGFNVQEWWEGRPPRGMSESTTLQATGLGSVATLGGAFTGIGQLDGNAQIIAIVVAGLALFAFAWIARERIKKWGSGRR